MPLPRFLFVLFFSILTSVILGSCGDTQQSALSGNLLGGETSPYLLQHASNPVHWKPWDESVFERAREEKKLVLVSIGYSSCHWCHVMEKETFEDDSVAAFMNKNFISIKVDREERPDVDEVYMTAVQLMTGSGGWPLNVVVLPNGKPIYGGTYHTRERWIEVLTEVQHQYEKDPVKLSEYADRVAQGVAEVNLIPAPEQTLEQQDISIEEAVLLWQSRWDTQWGGNAGVQKFMVPPNLTFLLNYTQLTQDQNSRDHLKTTLDRMAYGGVFDQIGGGFYRYSTDPRWHVPHFEKMLYDNAQLLSVYSKGFKLFSNPEYRRTVQAIFSFLKRDMRAPGGGYFAALDADSEGEEGKYYRWEESELREVLEGDYELFSHYYSVEPEMAWENQFYIPYRKTSDQEFAKSHNLKPDEFLLQKAGWNQKLMDKRSQRILPGIDDKIITSWNALLIIGLADSYDAFGEEEYLSEARDLYAFIKDHSYADGNLKHSYKPGDKRAMGFLEDYAFLARAAFRLYQITAESEYLEDATNLLDEIQKRFSDAESPLFRYREQSGLVSQILKTDDGVMPSPNTIIAGLFFELGHFYYIPEYLDKSRKMVTALQERFLKMPENYAGWGRLMLQQQKPYFEVAVAGPQALSLRDEMAKEFLPDVLLVASKTESDLPLFESRFDPETTWIYVCQDHTCQLPVSEVSQALRQIQDMDPRIFP